MRPPRKTVVVVEAPLQLPRAPDPEVLRFLHPQPPLPVPARTPETTKVGLVAHQLLGHRVYLAGS